MCVVVVSYAINRGILVVWSMFKGMPYAFYVLFAPGCLQCKRGEGDLRIRYGGGSGGTRGVTTINLSAYLCRHYLTNYALGR